MSPEMKINGSGAQGHVRKSRNQRSEGSEGSHLSKSKSYKFKLKQNHTTEPLSISLYKFTIRMAQNSQQM